MGNGASNGNNGEQSEKKKKEQEQKEVDTLRSKVFKLFSGQRFLLFGSYGSGKSSLINTINHVLNLSNPDVRYAEVAEVQHEETDYGTLMFTAYGSPEMYKELRQASRKNAPVFFDVAGVNDKVASYIDLKQLLIFLLNGKVRKNTEMIKIYNKEKSMDEIAKQREEKALKVWSILCVVSVYDTFPTQLLELVRKAVEQQKTAENGTDTRVFVILTKSDELDCERQQEVVKDYEAKCRRILGIAEKRIFVVQNYLSKQGKRAVKDLKTEKDVLTALLHILQPAHNPRWVSASQQMKKEDLKQS